MTSEPTEPLCKLVDPDAPKEEMAPRDPRWLKKREEELHRALLLDAQRDDNIEENFGFISRADRKYDVTNEDPARRLWTCEGSWPIGQALDELRLVRHRLHKLDEIIKQEKEDARATPNHSR